MSEYLEGMEEFFALASMYEVALAWPREHPWLSASQQLLQTLNHGLTREFVDDLLEQIAIRNGRAIIDTDYEYRAHHETRRSMLEQLRSELGDPAIPREISIHEGHVFTAKSKLREFFQGAETDILVVDPYIGVGTLDCLRGVTVQMRLLTGTREQSVEAGFERALEAFLEEDFRIEVRRHARLHDRHATFNDKCWLIGSSLKDAGGKDFNCIEIRDAKTGVIEQLEERWREADPI